MSNTVTKGLMFELFLIKQYETQTIQQSHTSVMFTCVVIKSVYNRFINSQA